MSNHKYQLLNDVASISFDGKEFVADENGIIELTEDEAAHPEFRRLGGELYLANKSIVKHTPPKATQVQTPAPNPLATGAANVPLQRASGSTANQPNQFRQGSR